MANPIEGGARLPLIVGAILVATGVAAACSSGGSPGAKPAQAGAGLYAACANNPDIGPGYDFPQPAGAVPGWVKDPNKARGQARARVHGWWLWIALNQGGASPLWRGWCNATQAFDMSTGKGGELGAAQATPTAGRSLGALRRGAAEAAEPIDLNAPIYTLPNTFPAAYPARCWNAQANQGYGALNDGPTYQSNGDIMVAGVVYNPAAYKWIRDKNLYKSAELTSMMPPAGGGSSHTQMGTNSVALKPMMWPVPASGYSALPVWTNATSDGGNYAGYEDTSIWSRAVAVTAGTGGGPPQNVTLQLNGVLDPNTKQPVGPNTYMGAAMVTTDQFYSYRPNLTGMDPCDRAILDASSYWAYGRKFQQGDALVLVAMHVMTKEQPDWAFQSFWWSDTPNDPVYGANRPIVPNAQGPWQHYLMTSTYGFPADANPSQWPIAFNPYIELAAGHPIQTNCMNCHKRAAWPPFYASTSPHASYLAAGGPGALDRFGDNDAIFQGLLTVDNVWSVSDRASPPAASAAAKAKAPGAAPGAGKAR